MATQYNQLEGDQKAKVAALLPGFLAAIGVEPAGEIKLSGEGQSLVVPSSAL